MHGLRLLLHVVPQKGSGCQSHRWDRRPPQWQEDLNGKNTQIPFFRCALYTMRDQDCGEIANFRHPKLMFFSIYSFITKPYANKINDLCFYVVARQVNGPLTTNGAKRTRGS